MDDDDDLSFLDARFDLNKLTKPQLRSILSVHAPQHLPAASAKKETLVTAVAEHVRPRAKSILSAQRRVRPSSAGITFLDDHSRPSPHKTSPGKRSGDKKTGSGSPSRSRSSSPRRSPSKKAAGRSAVKTEPDEVKTERRDKVAQTPLGSPLDSFTMPSYQDTPRTATRKLSVRFDELSSSDGAKDSRPGAEQFYIDWGLMGSVLRDALVASLIVATSVAVALFVRWKYIHPFPYCLEQHQTCRPLSDCLFAPQDAFSIIKDYCVACPRHGRCPDHRLHCLDGFVKRANWGLGQHCVPDRHQLELVDKLGKTVMGVLSERAGRAICSADAKAIVAGMSETELKKTIHLSYRQVPKFEHLFKLAIDDLLKEGSELRVRRPHDEDGERFFESMRPTLSLACRARLFFWSLVDRNKRAIAGLLLSLAVAAVGYMVLKRRQRQQRRVAELIDSVFQLLAEQAAVHRRDPLTPAAVIVDQLRDALFLRYPGEAFLWPRVCAAVIANSNVREQAIHAHGLYTLSWEWIGMDIFSSGPIARASPPRVPGIKRPPPPPPTGIYPSLGL